MLTAADFDEMLARLDQVLADVTGSDLLMWLEQKRRQEDEARIRDQFIQVPGSD